MKKGITISVIVLFIIVAIAIYLGYKKLKKMDDRVKDSFQNPLPTPDTKSDPPGNEGVGAITTNIEADTDIRDNDPEDIIGQVSQYLESSDLRGSVTVEDEDEDPGIEEHDLIVEAYGLN